MLLKYCKTGWACDPVAYLKAQSTGSITSIKKAIIEVSMFCNKTIDVIWLHRSAERNTHS